jgi:hypothetical protein
VERADKDSDYAQNAVDKICHYRNLAIVLGAKPEHMLGEFDRKLCVDGIDKDDTGNGYHMSVQDCLDDVADTWGAFDALKADVEARISAAAALIGLAPALIYAGAGFLVLRHVEGRTLAAADLTRGPHLGQAIQLLRRCRDDMPSACNFPLPERAPNGILKHYLAVLAAPGERWHKAAMRHGPRVAALAGRLASRPLGFSHNDIHAGNLIDDGVKIWVNGTVVHRHEQARGVRIDEDQVPFRLLKGWNLMLFKVGQGNGAWGLAVRIADGSLRQVDDLEYDPKGDLPRAMTGR